MRIFLPLLVFGALGLGGWYILTSSKPQVPRSTLTTSPAERSEQTAATHANTDYSASFAIFTNSTFRIFTASMYHNLSSDVYIESSNPNIVHVKKANITWDDFFKTLPMKLSRDCLTTGTGQTFCTRGSQNLKFYINGILDQNALDRVINDSDKLLVTFGSETEAQIQKQLQKIPVTK